MKRKSKMKHTMRKTTTKWTGMAFLFLTIMAIGITSCKKDDEPTLDNNREEVATAFVRSIISYTPNGWVNYIEVVEDLTTNPDFSKAVEIGLYVGSDIHSVGEHPMTLNNDAKTITKWKVDKATLELSVEGVLSYASTGISSNDITFVSETTAFINDLSEGIIVEFNPSTMEITKTHNVTPLQYPDNFSFYTEGNLYNGKIIFPIQWNTSGLCCDYPSPLQATVGVFDPATKILTYDTDERAIGLHYNPLIDGDNVYLTPSHSQNNFIQEFYGAAPSPFTVLKLNSDGTINDSYSSDILDGLPDATLMSNSLFITQNKFVFLYSEDKLTGTSYDDRYSTRSGMEFHSVVYDLNTQETTPFTSFDKYYQVYLYATINGVKYYRGRYEENDNLNTDVLMQNSLESYTVISTIENGGVEYLGKLW